MRHGCEAFHINPSLMLHHPIAAPPFCAVHFSCPQTLILSINWDMIPLNVVLLRKRVKREVLSRLSCCKLHVVADGMDSIPNESVGVHLWRGYLEKWGREAHIIVGLCLVTNRFQPGGWVSCAKTQGTIRPPAGGTTSRGFIGVH